MGKEVLLIVIGAIIGFVPSVCILIVERIFDQIGKIKVYYKFISCNQGSWGVYVTEDQLLVLMLPTVLEIQNTTNSTKVIRDLRIEIYKGNKFISKTLPIEYTNKEIPNGSQTETESYGVENNSYSVVLEPRSIKKVKCLFAYKIKQDEIDKMDFDSLFLRYYDEKDKKIKYLAKNNLDGWKMSTTLPDVDWILLK